MGLIKLLDKIFMLYLKCYMKIDQFTIGRVLKFEKLYRSIAKIEME